jgi:two-component system, LytTR family, sensor kinase
MVDDLIFRNDRLEIMRWTPYVVATAVAWFVIFALISAMPVLSGVLTWERSLADTLTQWLPWLLVAPAIFYLVSRFPVERRKLGGRVALHLLTGFALVIFTTWISSYYLAPRIMSFVPSDHPDEMHGPRPMETPGHNNDLSRDGHHPVHHGPHGPPFWARAWFNVPIYLSLVSLSHASVYFRRSQQRDRRAIELETQLERSRLQALRMQLQPHFLFNTLNGISTLVQVNPQVAQDMLGSLGQMLRQSLESDSQLEVPLNAELKFLDSYLEIMQMRLGERLKVVRATPLPETLKAYVPTFILQPLVENAIQHGIEPGMSPGSVEIRVQHAGEQLILAVGDTGVGLKKYPDQDQREGVGLSNTKARLQSLYPGRHAFKIQNQSTGGCMVEITIPFHTTPFARTSESRPS